MGKLGGNVSRTLRRLCRVVFAVQVVAEPASDRLPMPFYFCFF